jgi:hypothetical protein
LSDEQEIDAIVAVNFESLYVLRRGLAERAARDDKLHFIANDQVARPTPQPPIKQRRFDN